MKGSCRIDFGRGIRFLVSPCMRFLKVNETLNSSVRFGFGLVLLLAVSNGAIAQDRAPIEFVELNESVFLAVGGAGANSEFLIGADQVIVVDSKMTLDSAEELKDAIQELTDKPITYLINTHVHIDHTGGNEVFGDAGAVIVGQHETRDVLEVGQRGGPPAPEAALPSITFSNNGQIRLHVGEEIVDVIPIPPAHATDNSIVHFHRANVFVLGDLYSPVRYPVMAGGTMQGFIEGVEKVLAMSNEESLFVPGIGPNATGRSDLQHYLEMLVSVRDRVSDMIESGMSLEQIIEAKPTQGFDEVYGLPNHVAFLPVLVSQLQRQ